MSGPIYLDHHATTPCDPRVLEAMLPFFSERFGNPASRQHRAGRQAREATEAARRQVAALIGAAPRDVTFTSGATEALNLALKGLVPRGREAQVNIVVSAIEHPAVLDVCEALAAEGVEVRHVAVDASGVVSPEAVGALLDDRTVAAAVMAANNEIGTLQPIAEIGALCRQAGVPLVCDAAQAAGIVPIDVTRFGADVLALSAHKLYGPMGIGALWVRGGRPAVRLRPLIHGGGHERGLRSGTLPVPLVVGFGEACRLAREEMGAESARLAALRDDLLARLQAGRPDIRVNGTMAPRLPHNLNVAIPGIQAEELLVSCSSVALSSGSACSTAKLQPSHVLEAIGLDRALVFSSLRFGLGRGTTAEDIERAAEALLALC